MERARSTLTPCRVMTVVFTTPAHINSVTDFLFMRFQDLNYYLKENSIHDLDGETESGFRTKCGMISRTTFRSAASKTSHTASAF